MKKPPLTEAERRNIVDRYTRGQGLAYIAMGINRDPKVVRAALVGAGVTIRKGALGGSWGWTGRAKRIG